MSIIFETNKPKSLSMVVEVKNVNNDDLQYTFNILVDGIQYGFPCVLLENTIQIEIPPLETVISGLKDGDYQVFVDVIGENKFHIRPYKETVTIKSEPSVEVIVSDSGNDNVSENVSVLVSALMVDETKETKERKKEKKKETTILSKMFN